MSKRLDIRRRSNTKAFLYFRVGDGIHVTANPTARTHFKRGRTNPRVRADLSARLLGGGIRRGVQQFPDALMLKEPIQRLIVI